MFQSSSRPLSLLARSPCTPCSFSTLWCRRSCSTCARNSLISASWSRDVFPSPLPEDDDPDDHPLVFAEIACLYFSCWDTRVASSASPPRRDVGFGTKLANQLLSPDNCDGVRQHFLRANLSLDPGLPRLRLETIAAHLFARNFERECSNNHTERRKDTSRRDRDRNTTQTIKQKQSHSVSNKTEILMGAALPLFSVFWVLLFSFLLWVVLLSLHPSFAWCCLPPSPWSGAAVLFFWRDMKLIQIM